MNHIHPQKLAHLAEGRLARNEMPEVLAHLEACSDCTGQLEMANDVLAEEVKLTPRRVQTGWWTTLAAAVILTVIGTAIFYGIRRDDDGIGQLVALVPHSERLVEPRLTGGFAWAEYRGPQRANGEDDDTKKMKLVGAAGEARERAEKDPSADAQHTAGVAMLLVDRSDEAIRVLQLATRKAPNDAAAWSDLAAAQYAAAVRLRRSSLFPEALASADTALRVDPKHPEALFNRALILQRLGLREEARAAWQAYLNVDWSSPWAAEAQRYLKEIPALDQDAQFKRELPRLERGQGVRELVTAYPQQSRTWGEGVFLGAWAEGNGDAKPLAIARSIGDALRPRGETLLGDAVAAIDRADDARRAALIAAHAEYKRGRMLYAQQKPSEAEVVLLGAGRRFEEGGSPMALLARYFAAGAAYDRGEIGQGCARIESLLRESERHHGYVSLVAQIQWQAALCKKAEPSWNEALTLARKAEATFIRQNELRNAAALSSIVASMLASIGRLDEGWEARTRAYDALSAAGNRERLLAAVSQAVQSELRLGHVAAARALVQVEESMTRSGGNPVLLADVLHRGALIALYDGDRDTAARLVSESARETAKIGDRAVRGQAQAHVELATGALLLESEPLRARESLSRAITAYQAEGDFYSLPEGYLLRARAALRAGDTGAAGEDLDRGIAIVERHAVRLAGAVVGTGVFDAATTLYEEAIRLRLDRGDEEAAFAYAERLHAQISPRAAVTVDLTRLRERLTGSGTAVLELVVLPEEVVAFCVTEKEVTTARSKMRRGQLDEAIARADVHALYDLLIRPSLAAIGDARSLIIVAAPRLRNIPFAALAERGSRQRLIERMAVMLAPSAALLERESAAPAPHSLLAVVLPSGDDNATLQDAAEEVADLRALYGRGAVLSQEEATFRAFTTAAQRANVLHIAGHTDREPAAGERAFVFSRGERVSWQTVAETPIGRGSVVVLSACETLRSPLTREERALSLGEAFLAAGARAVVGTLKPIADRDARHLFAAFHRQLASGVAEDEALRRVQLESLARGSGDAWRSVVLMTNRIPANL